MRVTVEGQDIELEVRGPEHAPALVFVHGLTTDRRIMLEAFEPVFANHPGWRRIYLDLPGHGASPGTPAAASADGLVACLSGLIRGHAGLLPAVVAHSYGSYLALGILRELPGLGGMFLTNPIVEPDVALRTVPPQRISTLAQGLEFADDAERQTFLAEATLQTDEVLQRFRRVVDPAHRATERQFLAMVRARYAMSAPWSSALRAFDRPLHVVCGQDDYWSGYADAIDLVRVAHRCHFTVLPACGHLLPLEAVDELRSLFGMWLDELEAGITRR